MKQHTMKTWQRTTIAASLAALLVVAQAPLAMARIAVPEAGSTSIQQQAGFASLIKQVRPAVVNISTSGKADRAGVVAGRQFSMPDLPEGSPFGEFFEHFFKDLPDAPGEGRSPEVHGAGSGFIISADGTIVTNFHVIDEADEIEVITDDGARYPATVVGADPKTDIALLKVDAGTPLPFVELGDSSLAEVGDWVVAVGNQFGLGGSVTAGIISARGRDIQSGPFDDFLQIDAPINRGNSGGPLFDAGGKVIGINTAIYSPSGGNVGIGFAIPSNLARDVVDQLIEHGEVVRGWLGVQIQPLTEEIADSLGMEDDQGALVASVVAGSPADRAGIQPGDVITHMDGKALEAFKDLPRRVAAVREGTNSILRIWNSGNTREVSVVIGTMPSEGVKLAAVDGGNADRAAKLGLDLASLTAEKRRQYGVRGDSDGVLVTGVSPNGPAAEAGIRPGYLIDMVGQQPVTTPEQVIEQLQHAVKKHVKAVLLRVAYRGETRFVSVRLAAA